MFSTVGILGCGHLGLSIARTLLANGLPRAKLRVTVSGSPEGRTRVAAARLQESLVTNAALAEACDLIVITLRPGHAHALRGLSLRDGCTVVSAMAGLTTNVLEELLDHDVVRIMPSNPRTIETGTAICALYPVNPDVSRLLEFLNMSVYGLPREQMFHAFTAMVCLPAVLLELELLGVTSVRPADDYGLPHFDEILHWAVRTTPKDLPPAEKRLFIDRMATKGGVTEAMVRAIRQDFVPASAIAAGIARSRELSDGRR